MHFQNLQFSHISLLFIASIVLLDYTEILIFEMIVMLAQVSKSCIEEFP